MPQECWQKCCTAPVWGQECCPVCLAKLGHQVVGVDTDAAKVARLRAGEPTIYEPGLADLMGETVDSGRLIFTSDYNAGIPAADFVFIAVGTPPGRRGEADLVFVKQAAKGIAGAMKKTVEESEKGLFQFKMDHDVLSTSLEARQNCRPTSWLMAKG